MAGCKGRQMRVFPCLVWEIVLRAGDGRYFPKSILTAGPGFQHENMPMEVALLLPTNDGPTPLVDLVVADHQPCAEIILGLFLADPFLNLPRECARLGTAGLRWIANLPSVEQQDEEFSRQLTDVGLDRYRELDALAAFRDHGFKLAVVVSDVGAASAALSLSPEAMIIMPRVGDFAAGFPSLRQRRAAAQTISSVLRDADWQGMLLGLGNADEIRHEGQWPENLHGLLCRPQLAQIDAPLGTGPEQ